MAVLKPRNRIFLIRFTQEEYDTLRRVSTDRGARSLADFARSMLLASIAKSEPGGADPLDEIYRILSGLHDSVGRIANTIEQMSQTRPLLREAKKA